MNPYNQNSGDSIEITERSNRSASGGTLVPVRYRRQNHGYSDETFEQNLRDYLSAIFRRKGTIAVVFVTTFLAVVLYTVLVAPTYRSVATLEIEKEAAQNISGEATPNPTEDRETFPTQVGVLRSRTLVELLVDKMNLLESDEFDDRKGILGGFYAAVHSVLGQTVDDMTRRDRVVKDIMDRVFIKREPDERLLTISIEATDGQLAQQMLQHYIDNYLERNLEKKKQAKRVAASWLGEELGKAEARFEKSLANMVEFAGKHGLVSLKEEHSQPLRVFSKAADGLVRAKENRILLESSQLDRDKTTLLLPPEAKSPDMQSLQSKLWELESEYARKREIYSERSPQMITLKNQLDYIQSKLQSERNSIVSSTLGAAKRQEELYQESVEKTKKEALENNSLGVQLAILKKEAEMSEDIFKIILKKAKETELSVQTIGNNILVIDPPSLPLKKYKPKVSLNLVIGAVLGLILGIVAALVRENLDNNTRDIQEIAKLDLPYLGIIPKISGSWAFQGTNGIGRAIEFLPHNRPISPVSDAMHDIKTSLVSSYNKGMLKVMMATSPSPGEGKTFFMLSMASVLRSHGKKVLIADMDFRTPRIGKIFGKSPRTPGLTSLLAGPCRNLYSIVNESPISGLYYVTAGPVPQNPTEILESEQLDRLIAQFENSFDFVLIDSPPVLGFSDARILSEKVSGIILVLRQGIASLDSVRMTMDKLSFSEQKILGIVYNGVDVSSRIGEIYFRSHQYYMQAK
ncbi:MAG TPA: polysaccharide biosynthesis tyrosine autokinase [Desulfomonilaceae bacterium]|nr:polysaccharide biosynthesis tyrosine autokinase [Desulfomonilaceae bacterium]